VKNIKKEQTGKFESSGITGFSDPLKGELYPNTLLKTLQVQLENEQWGEQDGHGHKTLRGRGLNNQTTKIGNNYNDTKTSIRIDIVTQRMTVLILFLKVPIAHCFYTHFRACLNILLKFTHAIADTSKAQTLPVSGIWRFMHWWKFINVVV